VRIGAVGKRGQALIGLTSNVSVSIVLSSSSAILRRQLEENLGICLKFFVVVNDVRRALRNHVHHLRWTYESRAHFVPFLLSHLLLLSYSL
jgi:hypothetical protein